MGGELPSGIGRAETLPQDLPGRAPQGGVENRSVPDRAPLQKPSGHITLVRGGQEDPTDEAVRVPYFDPRNFDPDWLSEDAFSIPQEIEHAYRVRRDRRFVPIRLGNGQQVMIPVVDVEFMPRRVGTYQ